jgi:hypothetical protein
MAVKKREYPYLFSRREHPEDGPWTVYSIQEDCVVIFRTLGPKSLPGAWQFIAAERRPGDAQQG